MLSDNFFEAMALIFFVLFFAVWLIRESNSASYGSYQQPQEPFKPDLSASERPEHSQPRPRSRRHYSVAPDTNAERESYQRDLHSRIRHTPPPVVRSAVSRFSKSSRRKPGNDRYGLEQSPLKVFGYRVGKTGLPRDERRQVLEFAVFGVIPDAFPQSYRSAWGEPGTPQRYEAILGHLRMLQSTRRGQYQYRHALADWYEDYRWLVESYGDLMQGYRKYLI